METPTSTTLEAAFRAGFQAGFSVSREGFNGEFTPFTGKCTPDAFVRAEAPLRAAEEALWQVYRMTVDEPR